MSIGKKLLSLRQQKGLSQQELADYLHVSRQTVSKWESDLSLPDMKMSLMIAEFYDISITELLGIEEETSQDSLKQLYEKTNVVLDNMQREFKRNRLFDFGIIGICILSLVISLFLLIKSNNKNEQIINNNYYENVDNTQKETPEVIVEKYYLDTMSADVFLKFVKDDITSDSKAYIYLKDSDNQELQLPLTLTRANAFEYRGNIKLDDYQESVIVLESDNKKSRFEWTINEDVLSDSDLLRCCFTVSVPNNAGVLDTSVIKYEMVKSVNGIRIQGALEGSLWLKIRDKNGEILFMETIESHYNREFKLSREIRPSEELRVDISMTKGHQGQTQGFVTNYKRVTFEYPKTNKTDFYIINEAESRYMSH